MQFYLSLEHDTFKTNVIDFLPVLKKIGPLPWAFGACNCMILISLSEAYAKILSPFYIAYATNYCLIAMLC